MPDDDAVADGVGGGPVQRVEQLHERNGGRAVGAAVLVGAGIGDHQPLGRRTDRVEQQLAVLGTRIAFAGQRIAGQHVVTIDDTGAREHAVVEADQAHHPVRHGAHRHHRAHRERAGAEVGPGRASAQLALQQGPHVGQPQLGLGARARVGQDGGELTLQLCSLPGIVVVDRGQRRDAVSHPGQPLPQRLGP